jgi:DNA-binding transcriptional LysR family regulator
MPEPADLNLRLVRYFTVVAEQLHFGRAAQILHLAQPSLSRQVRRLEEQVGARLLDRTPQGSRLTEAGAAFLPQARMLLRTADRAAASARSAAAPTRLTVGYMAGVIVTPAVRRMRRQHPDADIKTTHLTHGDVPTALQEHRIDVLVARLPFGTEGLHVSVLYDEPRMLVVPLDHRLAGRASVTFDDIADEPMPRVRSADPDWSAYWRVDPRPDGRHAPDGPLIDGVEDKFEVVAAGQAVVIAAAVRGATLRPDLTMIPLEGADPSQVAVATRADDRSRLAAAFCKYAHAELA